MKFEFTSDKKSRAVCRDVGRIDKMTAYSSYGEPTLDFWVNGKRYSSFVKPTALRLLGFLGFGCMEKGGKLLLDEPPESGP